MPLKFVWFGLGQSSIAAIANAVKQIPDTPMVNKAIKPKAKIKSLMIISRDFRKRGPIELSPVKKKGEARRPPRDYGIMKRPWMRLRTSYAPSIPP